LGQFHRIQWIHERLAKKEYPNCKDVSQAFEISRRQALRDMDYLRYSLNAPVEYNRGKSGYEYTEPFSLPTFFLRDQERDRLEYLAAQYAIMPGKNSKELSELFQKISGERLEAKKTLQYNSTDFEDVIGKAIAYNRKLNITYQKRYDSPEVRIIDPYRLFMRNTKTYLFAFCQKRRDFRIFLLERIKRLEISELSYAFHEDFYENYQLTARSFTRQQKYKARIFFSLKPDLNRFTEPQWDEQKNILTFSFVKSANLFQKLINLDLDHPDFTFSILSPNWLKEKFMVGFQNLIDHL